MKPGAVNLSVTRGGSLYQRIGFTSSTGAAINLTGSTFELHLRTALGAASSVNCTSYLTVPTPSNGILVVNVPPSVTATLTATRYVFDLKWTDAAGIVTFPIAGTLEVRQGVTP